jgi:hypothetical protein
VSTSGVGDVDGLVSDSLGLAIEEVGLGSAMSGSGSSSQAVPRVARRRATASTRRRATCTSFPEKAVAIETTDSGPA